MTSAFGDPGLYRHLSDRVGLHTIPAVGTGTGRESLESQSGYLKESFMFSIDKELVYLRDTMQKRACVLESQNLLALEEKNKDQTIPCLHGILVHLEEMACSC